MKPDFVQPLLCYSVVVVMNNDAHVWLLFVYLQVIIYREGTSKLSHQFQGKQEGTTNKLLFFHDSILILMLYPSLYLIYDRYFVTFFCFS